MKKAQVTVGETYVVKVSGNLVHVRLLGESPYGGWDGVNLQTKRRVRIKTAAKLRRQVGTGTYVQNLLRQKPWTLWTGNRVTNEQTGKVYIETDSTSWSSRLKVWQVMYGYCKQQSMASSNCPCPFPTPQGHLMFSK